MTMKVSVREEPACKRVLEIEVESERVTTEMDKVVREFQRTLSMPGFRKGKVPGDVVRKRMGDDLEGEVLRRVLPKALDDALREEKIRPLGEPRITDLKFEPGAPLAFTATVEVRPEVTVEGYEGLKVTREAKEIADEDINQVLDRLRDERAELEDVDRPSQNGDMLGISYVELDEAGNPKEGEEPVEITLELGSERTPDSFNAELLGTVVGDMKKVPLPYPADYPEEDLAGTTRTFHVTVSKIQEKVWAALEDSFAQAVLGNEEATLGDLRTRIRLNLEMESRMAANRDLENKLVGRILELNPFELPEGPVNAALERILADTKEKHPDLPADEEEKVREHYRQRVENDFRVEILFDALGNQEQIEVSDEDLDKEIQSFAENEGEKPAKVRARLKKEGGLERLRDDLFRRRVLDRLVEKADVAVPEGAVAADEEKA